MAQDNITCPKCSAEFPLGEAVSVRLRDQLAAEFEAKAKDLNAALSERETKLKAAQQSLETREKSVAEQVAKVLESERSKLKADAARDAAEQASVRLKDLEDQLSKQKTNLDAARDEQAKLLREKRQLEDAKDVLKLEMEKTLAAERAQIADKARQDALDAEKLKLADKDNKIKELSDRIADLQRKAEQGSVQAQGETLELVVEQELAANFRYDEIVEVKKGQRGADVRQVVRTNTGAVCGEILWEAKRADNWQPKWIAKIKDDQREVGADLAVIVTTSLPPGVRGIGTHEGVWVCEPPFAIALGSALRHGIISTAAQRVQQANRLENEAILYDYLCGVKFRQHIEALVETFIGLQKQIETEKRAFTNAWSAREAQIATAIKHTAGLYGDIQGYAGAEALPAIGALALTES